MEDYNFKKGMVVTINDGYITGASKDFTEQFDTDRLVLKGEFEIANAYNPDESLRTYFELIGKGKGVYCKVKEKDENGEIVEVECENV